MEIRKDINSKIAKQLYNIQKIRQINNEKDDLIVKELEDELRQANPMHKAITLQDIRQGWAYNQYLMDKFPDEAKAIYAIA